MVQKIQELVLCWTTHTACFFDQQCLNSGFYIQADLPEHIWLVSDWTITNKIAVLQTTPVCCNIHVHVQLKGHRVHVLHAPCQWKQIRFDISSWFWLESFIGFLHNSSVDSSYEIKKVSNASIFNQRYFSWQKESELRVFFQVGLMWDLVFLNYFRYRWPELVCTVTAIFICFTL